MSQLSQPKSPSQASSKKVRRDQIKRLSGSRTRRIFFEPLEERRVLASFTLAGTDLTLGINDTGVFGNGSLMANYLGAEYFFPGTPHHRLSLSGNGTVSFNNYQGTTQIIGSSANTSSGSTLSASFTGVANGLSIVRNLSFDAADSVVNVNLTITNTTGTTISDVAFMDSADPDQGQSLSIPSTFATANDVVTVDGATFVRSSALDTPHTVGYGSGDSRAVASVEGPTNPFDIINSPVDPSGAIQDQLIAIAFDFGDLLPGESVSTRYHLVFATSPANADAAFAAALINTPPTADAGGPHNLDEGGSVALSAAGSTDVDGTITLYEWDLDNNGSYETTGISPTFSAVGIDGPATRTVGLRVTDNDGEPDTDTATITIENVEPSNLLLDLVSDSINENGVATLSGSFTDPGPNDTHTVSIDWGDGSEVQIVDLPAGVTTFSGITHTYLDDGPSPGNGTAADVYPISVTVSEVGGFQILSLTANNASIIDHNAITGDDDGGIAVSTTRVFYDGDSGTGRFNLADLSGGTNLGIRYHALTSNLSDGAVYVLGTSSTTQLLENGTGPVTHLLVVDDATGVLTGAAIALSQSLPVPPGNVGIFAGWNRVVIHDTANAFSIDLPSGTVTDLGPVALSTHHISETNRFWGLAEFFDGQVSLAYVRDTNTIVRTNVATSVTTTVATFPDGLSDMAGFTVDATAGRWYFHYEGFSGTFGGSNETLGYADATFSFGSGTGSTSNSTDVAVNNVAPEIELSLSSSSILENGSSTLTGTITDPGTLDEFTLDLNWGDPLSPDNTQSFALGTTALTVAADGIDWNPTTREFSLPHQYLDDNPSNTEIDDYTITATVTDDDLGITIVPETTLITVNNVDPIAAAFTPSTTEDDALPSFNVLASATDVGTLDVLQAVADSDAGSSGGVFTIAANGTLIFDPNGEFDYLPVGQSTTTSFTYSIVDDDDGTDSNTVTVTVNGENDAPVATGESHSIAEDNTLSVAAPGVLDNDDDVDLGAALTALLVNGPAHSSSFTLNADGSFTYTPAANYYGPDSFTYQANDGELDSNEVTVSLTVTPVDDFDFGDAPESYGVAQHFEGAGFIGGLENSGPLLGTRDFELVSQHSASAFGDDELETDDEEIVTFSSITLVPRLNTIITVNATAAGMLDAWIDFNGNGEFDAVEKIAAGLSVVAGSNELTITTPEVAVAGVTYARFRISTDGSALPTGLAADGEVEDYQLSIMGLTPGASQVIPNPTNPEGPAILLVNGTSWSDAIVVRQTAYAPVPMVTVYIAPFGTTASYPLSAFGEIVIFGYDGSDSIVVEAPINKPASVYGDAGNDSISGGLGNDYLDGGTGYDSIAGGAGDDILQGGADADTLSGDAGRDLILGGLSYDTLLGGADDDIELGGLLTDSSKSNLESILALWTTADAFEARITSLSSKLNSTTVLDDGVADYVYGYGGRDWLLDFAMRDYFFDYDANPLTGDRKN